MNTFICTGNIGKSKEFKKFYADERGCFCLNDLAPLALIPYCEPVENSDYFIANGVIKLFSALQFVLRNAQHFKDPIDKIIVDDSGLCVPRLNFLPGVHSAMFAGLPKNNEKNNELLKEKIEAVIEAKIVGDEKRLDAFFVCFLFSLNIDDYKTYEDIIDVDFSQSDFLLKQGEFENKYLPLIEQKLLNKVDLKKVGGNASEKIKASLLHPAFPETVFIELHYGFCCGEISTHEQRLLPNQGFGYDALFYPLLTPNISFASVPIEEKNKNSHRAFAIDRLRHSDSSKVT